MRLACVKHAASVRSEPGSNSQVHQRLASNSSHRMTLTPTNRPNSTVVPQVISNQPSPAKDQTSQSQPRETFKAFVTHQTNTSQTPISSQVQVNPSQPKQQPNQSAIPTLTCKNNPQDAANVSLPNLCNCQRAPPRRGRREPDRSAAGGAF